MYQSLYPAHLSLHHHSLAEVAVPLSIPSSFALLLDVRLCSQTVACIGLVAAAAREFLEHFLVYFKL